MLFSARSFPRRKPLLTLLPQLIAQTNLASNWLRQRKPSSDLTNYCAS